MFKKDSKGDSKKSYMGHHGGSGGIWFLGFVGTLLYFLHVHSGTFWLVVLAFLKAIVWPAFLVYHLWSFIGI